MFLFKEKKTSKANNKEHECFTLTLPRIQENSVQCNLYIQVCSSFKNKVICINVENKILVDTKCILYDEPCFMEKGFTPATQYEM